MRIISDTTMVEGLRKSVSDDDDDDDDDDDES